MYSVPSILRSVRGEIRTPKTLCLRQVCIPFHHTDIIKTPPVYLHTDGVPFQGSYKKAILKYACRQFRHIHYDLYAAQLESLRDRGSAGNIHCGCTDCSQRNMSFSATPFIKDDSVQQPISGCPCLMLSALQHTAAEMSSKPVVYLSTFLMRAAIMIHSDS